LVCAGAGVGGTSERKSRKRCETARHRDVGPQSYGKHLIVRRSEWRSQSKRGTCGGLVVVGGPHAEHGKTQLCGDIVTAFPRRNGDSHRRSRNRDMGFRAQNGENLRLRSRATCLRAGLGDACGRGERIAQDSWRRERRARWLRTKQGYGRKECPMLGML